jgi:urease accessory protein
MSPPFGTLEGESSPVSPGEQPNVAPSSLSDVALLRLLQFTSPALPIGAFAFSQGAEGAVTLGFIRDEESARSWLGGTLVNGLARLDLPLLGRLHAAFASGDDARVLFLSRYLLAARESEERYLEDLHLGRALARLLFDQGVAAAGPLRGSETVTHATLFALAAVSFSVPLATSLLGFAFSWLENQVGALARLVPLGQLAAQRVLASVSAELPAAVALASSLPDEELGATLPGVALASALHETQYCRLFKS